MIGDAKLAAGGAALPNGKERNKNNVDIESPCRLKENKVPNFGERRHLIFSSLSLCLFFFWLVRLLLCALNGHFRWRGCVRLSLSLHAPSMRRLFILIKYLFYYERSLSLSPAPLWILFFFFLFQQKRKKGALSLYTEVFRCIRLYGSIRAGVAVRCYFFEASEGLLGLFFCSSSAVWPLSLMSITFFSCLRL